MRFYTTLVALFAILPVLNCSNSSAVSDPPVNEDYGYLRCYVKGIKWQATKMQPDKYVSDILQIAGFNGKSELWVQINNPAPGRVDSVIYTDLNHFTDEKTNIYISKGGWIAIREMDDQWVRGVFAFDAFDRNGNLCQVSEGEFKVPNPKRFK
jgi:hypothetical protein